MKHSVIHISFAGKYAVQFNIQDCHRGNLYKEEITQNVIARNSMAVLWNVFGHPILSCLLWPAHTPNLTPCDYYVCISLKDKAHKSNSQT